MKMKLHITQFNLYIKCNLHVKLIFFVFFKHFDQCGSHNDKNSFYFGGTGQVTNTIT